MLFKNTQGADFMIVGLGNPGSKYRNTRHNIGFAAVDYIARKLGVNIDKAKFHALYAIAKTGDKKVLLLKPQTFMNLSGEAVSAASRFYKISPENILIIYDDVSLPVGKMRIRLKGSAGGHNGIKSIISHTGENFARIKLGVGEKPHPDYDLADWVLGKFSREDSKVLSEKFESAYQASLLIMEGQADKAMNLYNR